MLQGKPLGCQNDGVGQVFFVPPRFIIVCGYKVIKHCVGNISNVV